MPQKQTRAQYYGVDANKLARQSMRKLTTIRAKLLAIPDDWQGLDPALEADVDNALKAIDKVSQTVKDSAQYLNEPYDE